MHHCFGFSSVCQLLHKVQEVAAFLCHAGTLLVELQLLVKYEFSHCSIYLKTLG